MERLTERWTFSTFLSRCHAAAAALSWQSVGASQDGCERFQIWNHTEPHSKVPQTCQYCVCAVIAVKNSKCLFSLYYSLSSSRLFFFSLKKANKESNEAFSILQSSVWMPQTCSGAASQHLSPGWQSSGEEPVRWTRSLRRRWHSGNLWWSIMSPNMYTHIHTYINAIFYLFCFFSHEEQDLLHNCMEHSGCSFCTLSLG